MKKLLISSLCLAATLVATAAPLTKEQARQQAASFLMKKSGAHRMPAKDASQQLTDAADIANGSVFAFNVGTGNGFVVVVGDDRLPAILGYADKGYVDNDNMPENMRAWLQSYADQLAAGSAKKAPVAIVNGQAISPMLKTTWDQGAPYNLLCPVMPETGVHAFTGCVATAMAQVMNYHQWPQATTKPIPAYESYQDAWGNSSYSSYWADYDIYNYVVVDEIGITTIDWENMLSAYDSQATETQQQAVARLMQLCGASVGMQYNDVGSSLSGNLYAVDALVNYFDYDRSVHNVARTDFKAAQWNQLIYDELAAGRPLLYNGQSSGGGHSFVVDGYDKDNFFHVNWGWSGDCDGFFLLAGLEPESNSGSGASSTTDGYNYWQGAVIGIQPQQGTPAPAPVLTSTLLKIWNDQHDFNLASDDRFGLTFNYANRTRNSGTWKVMMAFLDEEGNMVSHNNGFEAELASGQEEENTGEYYWEDFSAAPGYHSDLGYRLPLPDGTYRFVLCCQPVDDESGAIYVNQGMEEHFATVTIANGKLTMTWPEPSVVSLAAEVEAVGQPEIYAPSTVRFTVTNNGSDFNQDVFFTAGGQQQAGNVLEVNAGETVSIDFVFTPQAMGDMDVALTANDGTQIANGTISVIAPEAKLSISATVKNQINNVVSRNKATITLNVENTGSNDYTKDVIAAIYKEGDDGEYYYAGEQSQFVNIGAGQAASVDFTFEGMENGANYLVNMFYLSSEGYVHCDNYTWFAVMLQEAQLAIAPTVKNAVRYLDDEWTAVVAEQDVVLDYNVTNEGTTDYSGELIATIYKFDDDGLAYPCGEVSTMAALPAGDSKHFELTLEGMEDGATYFIYAEYISNGEKTMGYEYTPYFTIELTATGISTARSNEGSSTIYTLDGRQMRRASNGSASLRQLPKGIYIVNGKKVRN